MRIAAPRAVGVLTLLFAVACAVFVAMQPQEGHWSADGAAKYLAVKSIRIEGGHLRYDVPYLGKGFDPGMWAVPVGETYWDLRDGEVHISWPELFPLMVAPFYAAFGWLGLFVVPILGGAASVYLTGAIAERLRAGSGTFAAALVVLAAPIGFYSVLLWEHTPALALILLALWLFVDFRESEKWSRVVAGCACLGLASAGLRTDVNLFFVSAGAAMFLVAKGRTRWMLPFVGVAGFVLGAAPASALNWITNGKLLAANTVKNTPPPSFDYIKEVGLNIFPHFLAGKLVDLRAAWCAIFGATILVIAHTFVNGRARWWLAVGGMIAMTVGSVMAFEELEPLIFVVRFHGILLMSPVLALGALVPRKSERVENDPARLVAWIALIYATANLVALALSFPNGWASEHNREWGPRYWLALFPLLAILVAVRRDIWSPPVEARVERFASYAGVALVLAVSVVFELYGLKSIAATDQDLMLNRYALEQDAETPLMTDFFLTSSVSPRQYFRRPSFYLPIVARDRWVEWFPVAAARGLVRFDFATFTDVTQHPFLKDPIGGYTFVIDSVTRERDLRIAHVHVVRSELADSTPLPQPDGAPWQIAGVPDLGALNDPHQQPVDFSIWQAADGTWQLWSCIRMTKAPGQTRLFYAWEAKNLTDANWTPKGIAMQAETSLGETAGGLQAPYVFRVGDTFHMVYGDWTHICHATSKDGKHFERVIQKDGTTAMFSEGPDAQARDPMVLPIDGKFYAFYTAYPRGIGEDFMRTSTDLTTWSDSKSIATGGSSGNGKFSAECPFVVKHDDAFYLFRTEHYGADPHTYVYRSKSLDSFGVNEDSHLVEKLPLAAPEIVTADGHEYIAWLRDGLDGIQMSRLEWKPHVETSRAP